VIIRVNRGSDAVDYELDVDSLSVRDAEVVESMGGGVWDTYREWIARLRDGNIRALHVAAWHVLREESPRPSMDDLYALPVTAFQVDVIGSTERDRATERILSGEITGEAKDFWVDVLGFDPVGGSPKASPSDSPKPVNG
jgi:hypothetical protein